MDKTTLNLVSMVLGGTGLFVVLTKFNVPELNKSFFGTNPFAIKRDEIESVMTWLFTTLTLVALLIQVGALIFDDQIEERLHTTYFYVFVFMGSLVVAGIFVLLLTVMGNKLARDRWLLKIVESQMEIYETAKFISENNGWRKEQLLSKDTIADPDRDRSANRQTADKYCEQIEKLLDINPNTNDLSQRLMRLKSYFEG